MRLARYLKPNLVRLGLREGHLDQLDPEKNPAREKDRLKAAVIDELSGIFALSGAIRNLHKFSLDFTNGETALSSALPAGFAVPQVRSLAPRSLVLIFARSRAGVWFAAPEDGLTHLIFGVAAPRYAPKEADYFAKMMTENFMAHHAWLAPALLAAEDEHEIIGLLSSLE